MSQGKHYTSTAATLLHLKKVPLLGGGTFFYFEADLVTDRVSFKNRLFADRIDLFRVNY